MSEDDEGYLIDSKIQKRLRKIKTVSCDRCPYHKFENARRGSNKLHKNWKILRKTKYKAL